MNARLDLHPEAPSQVQPGLWVGGAVTAELARELTEAGVTHVLNLRLEPDDRALWPELHVGWAPTEDDLAWKPASWFGRGLGFARSARRDPQHSRFVPCAAGVHRAPLMVYAMLRALDGLSPAAAARTIRRHRATAQFPSIYLESAETFVAELDAGGRPNP